MHRKTGTFRFAVGAVGINCRENLPEGGSGEPTPRNGSSARARTRPPTPLTCIADRDTENCCRRVGVCIRLHSSSCPVVGADVEPRLDRVVYAAQHVLASGLHPDRRDASRGGRTVRFDRHLESRTTRAEVHRARITCLLESEQLRAVGPAKSLRDPPRVSLPIRVERDRAHDEWLADHLPALFASG
jgi:hypothetical protein